MHDEPALLVAATQALIAARMHRDRVWPAGRLTEPGWDLLLELYIAHLERRSLSISSLGLDKGIAPTTVLRKIAEMERVGLVTRRPDPRDRRRMLVTLNAATRDALTEWVTDTVRSALSYVVPLL